MAHQLIVTDMSELENQHTDNTHVRLVRSAADIRMAAVMVVAELIQGGIVLIQGSYWDDDGVVVANASDIIDIIPFGRVEKRVGDTRDRIFIFNPPGAPPTGLEPDFTHLELDLSFV